MSVRFGLLLFDVLIVYITLHAQPSTSQVSSTTAPELELGRARARVSAARVRAACVSVSTAHASVTRRACGLTLVHKSALKGSC